MKLTCVGFLICLIALFLVTRWPNYGLGGPLFFGGVIVAVVGLCKKWN